MELKIREITCSDNEQMAKILRDSLEDFGLNIPGTAYFDESTDRLYQSFQGDKQVYYVAELNGELVGGVGLYPTQGLPSDTVELVKMYVKSSCRGQGVGKKLMLQCIEKASDFGYEKIYLETMPELSAAVSAYEKLGFVSLDKPLGDTGHFSCTIWMLRTLNLSE